MALERENIMGATVVVLSRYKDNDGNLNELVSHYDSSGLQVLEERYIKSRFNNRRLSDFVGEMVEAVSALFAFRNCGYALFDRETSDG